MIINQNSCAFTGHRPHKLPWKDNEDDLRCVALKKTLTEQISALAGAGVTDFFSGMAAGTDHYCAQIVLVLREENPALKLHCVLPYEGQADKCSDSARERYHAILKQGLLIRVVSASSTLWHLRACSVSPRARIDGGFSTTLRCSASKYIQYSFGFTP